MKVPLPRVEVPAEINHTNLQATMDLTMGVQGRDLGHVAEDVNRIVATFGKARPDGGWSPFDPDAVGNKVVMEGARIVLVGEYQKMEQTFRFQAMGMAGAVLLIYFLMVALFRSYVTPLVVLSAVPIGLIGVILMLYFTGTALNVQSLLGVIFMVGIVVSNTVLLIDFAENVRKADRITPLEAIRRAAAVRVRPVVMTALATFFALIPMSLGLSRGSEANVPLGRAVLGGLVAGLVTTLLVVPCIYSLVVSNKIENETFPGSGSPEATQEPQPLIGENSPRGKPYPVVRAEFAWVCMRSRTARSLACAIPPGSGCRPAGRGDLPAAGRRAARLW